MAQFALITHHSEQAFHTCFVKDLWLARSCVLILSPFLAERRTRLYLGQLSTLADRGVVVTIYTRPRNEQPENLQNSFGALVEQIEDKGIQCRVRSGMHEKVAVIDANVLWHGSLNILSHNATRESMLRFELPELIREILADLDIEQAAPKKSGASGTIVDALAPHCPVCSGAMHYFAVSHLL